VKVARGRDRMDRKVTDIIRTRKARTIMARRESAT
jgi:hypothetical protein